MSPIDALEIVLAFVPSAIVIGAVLTQSKNISALAQLGR
jgi:hypothetical protein